MATANPLGITDSPYPWSVRHASIDGVKAVRGRWLLAGAFIAVIGLGLAALLFWLTPGLFGPFGGDANGTAVDATVSQTAACDDADPHDTVEFTVSGRHERARLDGCGNAKGQHLRVIVPTTPGGALVQMSDASWGNLSAGYRGAGFGLFALSCVAGAGFGLLLSRRLPSRSLTAGERAEPDRQNEPDHSGHAVSDLPQGTP